MDAPSSQFSESNVRTATERVFAASSQTNDLLLRVSSFLPQIRAANCEALLEPIQPPLLYQENDESDKSEDESAAESNDSTLIREIDQGESPTRNPESLSKDESDCVDDFESKPSKKRKLEGQNPTIVMDLHFNQDTEHPLFQLLCDEKDDVEHDGTDSNNQRSTQVSNSDSLISSVHQKSSRNHSLITAVANESNEQGDVP